MKYKKEVSKTLLVVVVKKGHTRTTPQTCDKAQRRKKTLSSDHLPLHQTRRTQGRDSRVILREEEWAVCVAAWDSVPAGQRIYHRSEFVKEGATWESEIVAADRRAREFEDAGIDLGHGRCRHQQRDHAASLNGAPSIQDGQRRISRR